MHGVKPIASRCVKNRDPAVYSHGKYFRIEPAFERQGGDCVLRMCSLLGAQKQLEKASIPAFDKNQRGTSLQRCVLFDSCPLGYEFKWES